MRLINTYTRKFKEFDGDLPIYAILSHTWSEEEVTYQDYIGGHCQGMKGYNKIDQTCRKALGHSIPWAWVDTCCIDKSSSAELVEAINSMYRWYERASICYVHLSDISEEADWSGLESCRWFTRGWTLQELIAPKHVTFFNSAWKTAPEGFGGSTKLLLASKLAKITRINRELLVGERPLASFCVAQRISWAANRRTKRVEDTAYCLLGLLGLSMPLLYGEGNKAFLRLQEEVIRSISDLSILAWSVNEDSGRGYVRHNYEPRGLSGLLALSPTDFRDCGQYERLEQGGLNELSVSTLGIKARTKLLSVALNSSSNYDLCLPLDCSLQGHRLGVRLKVINSHRYVRSNPYRLHKCKHSDYIATGGMTQSTVEKFLLTRLPSHYPRRRHDPQIGPIFDLSAPEDVMKITRYCVLRIITTPEPAYRRFWPSQFHDTSEGLFFVTGPADEAFSMVDLKWPVPQTGSVLLDNKKLSCKIIAIEWSSEILEDTHFGVVLNDEYGPILDDIQNRFSVLDQTTDSMRSKLRAKGIPQTRQVHRRIPGTDWVAVVTIKPHIATENMLGGEPFLARRCIDIEVSGSIHRESMFHEVDPEPDPWPSPRRSDDIGDDRTVYGWHRLSSMLSPPPTSDSDNENASLQAPLAVNATIKK